MSSNKENGIVISDKGFRKFNDNSNYKNNSLNQVMQTTNNFMYDDKNSQMI